MRGYANRALKTWSGSPVTSGLLVSVQAAAEQMLETGIAVAKALSGRADSQILGNAVYLAAAVSARHALPGDRFSLSLVNNVAKECRDDDTRLKLLRAVIRAWIMLQAAQATNDLTEYHSRVLSRAIGTCCRAKRPRGF